MLEELSMLLEFKNEYATVKQAQTIGALERSLGPLKDFMFQGCLRFYGIQTQKVLHNLVDLAAFQQNTDYHSAIAFLPTLKFHGGIS